MKEEYPQFYFLSLDHDFLEVRITLNLIDDRFSTEIDLVQKESRKIYKHLGIVGPFDKSIDKDEAINLTVQEVSLKLKK